MKLRFRNLYNEEHGAYPNNSSELVRYIEHLLNQLCKVPGDHVHYDRLLEWVSSGRQSALGKPDRQQDTSAGSGSSMDGSCPNTDAQTKMGVEQLVASGPFDCGCLARLNVWIMQARRRFFFLWWIRKKRKHHGAAKMRRRIRLSVATELPTSEAGAMGCGGMGEKESGMGGNLVLYRLASAALCLLEYTARHWATRGSRPTLSTRAPPPPARDGGLLHPTTDAGAPPHTHTTF